MLSISLFIILKLYNEPLLNVHKAKADIEVLAQNILEDYRKDELTANKKYVGNLIQIQGKVSKITIENGNSVISLKDINDESSIMCHMSPEENLKALKLKDGDQIVLKGICTGYLMDVIMVRCIIINN
jgi:exonuclease VII large subunit